MTKSWNPLKKGDKVAILNPSLPEYIRNAPEELEDFKRIFGKMGLELAMTETLPQNQYFCWMGSPRQRAEHIIATLNNHEIKAVFITGGNCAGEVMEILKREKHRLPKAPGHGVVAFGVSDGDQALHFLGQIMTK